MVALEDKLFSPASFSMPLMKSLRKMDIFCLATSVYGFDLNQLVEISCCDVDVGKRMDRNSSKKTCPLLKGGFG